MECTMLKEKKCVVVKSIGNTVDQKLDLMICVWIVKQEGTYSKDTIGKSGFNILARELYRTIYLP